MDRLFNQMAGGAFLRGWPRRWGSLFEEAMETDVPHVDLIDRENEIVLRAEIPGVDKVE